MIRYVRRTVRFSEEEAARYEEAARLAGVDFSEYVRRALEASSRARPAPAPTRPIVTGRTLLLHTQGCPCRACTTRTVVTVSGDKEV